MPRAYPYMPSLLHFRYMSFTVYLGADHAGFQLKEQVKTKLLRDGYAVYDLTPNYRSGDDYPLVARIVATHVSKDKGSRGVLVCGTGVGVTIGANRIKGIRAFDAWDAKGTKLARHDDDANIIAFSGWRLTFPTAKKLLDIFFKTRFSVAKRHHRRVKQLG